MVHRVVAWLRSVSDSFNDAESDVASKVTELPAGLAHRWDLMLISCFGGAVGVSSHSKCCGL